MKRFGVAAAVAAATLGCFDNNGPAGLASVVLAPVLDSLFVGDTGLARQITFYDANGTPQNPGVIAWSSSDTTIVRVDGATGRIVGLQAGFAVVRAEARGIAGVALVIVSRPLHLSLLLDSIYLMPSDTFTVPVAVLHQVSGVPTVWFTAPTNAVFDLDSATGRVTAKTQGSPLQFIAHAALGTDTVADSGTVEVVSLADTVADGKAYYTLFGTVTGQQKVAARTVNYRRTGDSLTFRFRGFLLLGGVTAEAVLITLKGPVNGPGTFPIDSISPPELFGSLADPFCKPPRNWGTWSTRLTTTQLDALSRRGGGITITRVEPITGGLAIGGRFLFLAQRTDLYADPLGVLPVRGTFVAPLVAPAGSTCP